MQRTKTLTTYTILVYKSTVLLMVAVFLTFFFIKSAAGPSSLMILAPYIYLFYVMIKGVFGIKYVEYDQANLYVSHNDYQVQIPFEEIKEVKLMSIDGVYKFILFKKGQLGKEILCKPSIWYPFNFNKVDNELHRIRGLIYKRKQESYKEISGGDQAQLSSMNL
ncbi:MAG: hypothetical protein ACJA2S_002848 [Cyclobacteriaceae bacterium]|jgi:hypothetical protein